MNGFSVHWSRVPPDRAGASPGSALIALWPAPVNADACFQAAGFTDFGDADEAWEERAGELLRRLLAELGAHGTPRLASGGIHPRRGLTDRVLGRMPPEPPLAGQVEAPMHDDNLPDALVAFGESGVRLRAGSGHVLFWITLPEAAAGAFEAEALPRIAAGHPLHRTGLDWRHLLGTA